MAGGAHRWDAIVVGAGPAGATAAYWLARRGRRVLLLDRRRFPRDKTCGDALIADSLAALERMGLRERVAAMGHGARAIRVYSPSRIPVDLAGEFVLIKRRAFDATLLEHAIGAGAAFRVGDVADVAVDAACARVTVRGESAPLVAPVAIVATGANVSLLARLGQVSQTEPSGMAVRSYVRSSVRIDELVISYDRGVLPGYGWIFPMGAGEYNVGCGVFSRDGSTAARNLRQTFDAFVARFPLAAELVGRASAIEAPKGAPLRCGLTGTNVLTGGRIVAIGETIGATFPFSGEGIGKAMETGELAAAAIDQAIARDDFGALSDLPARLERTFRRKYRGYQRTQELLEHPWVSDLIARRALRSPYLRRALGGVFTEETLPDEVLSLRTFLRSFVE